MQDTLNFPTTTTTTSATLKTPLKRPSKLTFPVKPHNFHKTSTLPTLSSKTTTIHPLKPHKTPPPPFPSPSPTHLPSTATTTTTPEDFREKALFLDSFGLDSLTTLRHRSLPSPRRPQILPRLPHLPRLHPAPAPPHHHHVPGHPLPPPPRHPPVFAFLLREAHVRADDLPRVISRRPRLLLSSIPHRLRPTLYFLQSIGIHDVHRHTNLLSASVEDKFLPKIDFFLKVGFQHHESISMFRKFPPLFCYSVKDNFEPKFNYFVLQMARDLKELKSFPQYFSFSLEKRIKSRHQICVESGVYFPLPVLLKMKEDDFRKRLDVCCNSSMPRSDSPLWVS